MSVIITDTEISKWGLQKKQLNVLHTFNSVTQENGKVSLVNKAN